MILIDTSVWIEFLRQNPTYDKIVRPLLAEQRVVTIEPVFAELLIGVRNESEKEIVFSYWNVLPRLGFGPDSMILAAECANSNDYLNKGIGIMDAIIIQSAIEGNHQLWTLDTRIQNAIDHNLIFQP